VPIRRVAAIFALVLSCASPTLPLPPPSLPSIAPSSTPGKFHLSSDHGAEPNAIILIYNRNPSVPLDQRVSGAQADAVGTWDADVQASAGDYLDISQEFGTTRSPPITVSIPR
jgi:hypothetical protein